MQRSIVDLLARKKNGYNVITKIRPKLKNMNQVAFLGLKACFIVPDGPTRLLT